MINKKQRKQKISGASLGSTIFNLCKGIIGSGLVVLPYDFKQTGYVFGIILIIIIMLASMFSLFQIAYSSDYAKVYQYRSIAEFLYNPSFGILTAITTIIYTIGSLMSYAIIIKTNATFFLTESWERIVFLWGVGVVVVLPLTLLPKIDFLKFSSIFALVALLYIVIIVIVFMCLILKNPEEYEYLGRDNPPITKFNASLSCMVAAPLMATAFTCHYNLGTQYFELRNHTPKRMLKAIIVTAIVVMIVNVSVGLSGYMAFGGSVTDNISKDLSRLEGKLGKITGSIASAVMILVVACTYPLVAFAVRKNIETLIFGSRKAKVKFLRSEAGLNMLKEVINDLNEKAGIKEENKVQKHESQNEEVSNPPIDFKNQIGVLNIVGDNENNSVVIEDNNNNNNENENDSRATEEIEDRPRINSLSSEIMSDGDRRLSMMERDRLVIERYSFGAITEKAKNQEIANEVIVEHEQELADGNSNGRNRTISCLGDADEVIAVKEVVGTENLNESQNKETLSVIHEKSEITVASSEITVGVKLEHQAKIKKRYNHENYSNGGYPEEVLKAIEVPVKRKWSILISLIIVLVTFIVATIVDSISDIVAFTSALCGSPLVYIYPSIFMIATLKAKKVKKASFVASWIVMIIGFIFLCLGLYSAIQTKIIDRL